MRPGDNYGGDRPLPPPSECRGSTAGAQCNGCPFSTREGYPNRPVVGEGAKAPLWIVVGEGPGTNEAIFGRPFVGASGAVMEKVLTSIRRPRKDIWISNATLCLPTPDASEDLRILAAQHCRERLRRELANFPGVPILAVGAPATKILLEEIFAKKAIEAPSGGAATPAQPQGPTFVSTPKPDPIPTPAPPGLFSSNAPNLPVRLRTALFKDAINLTELGNATAKDVNQKRKAKAKKAKVEKIKKQKAPKIRRPRGTSKNRGLTFSDVVSTLHRSKFVGDHDIRMVIPTIHPAAILRSSGKALKGAHSADLVFWNLQYDAGKIDALAQGRTDILFSEDVSTEIFDEARAARLVRDIIAEARAIGEVAIDLETHVSDQQRHHALMMYVAEIKAIGIATPERAVSVMWDLLGPLAIAALRELLADPTVVKIFHNGNYDRTVLRARGFILSENWGDTMLAHHATFPGMAHKLQLVAGQFYAIRPWKSEFRDSEETPAALTVYCALDTLSTARLRAPLEILVRKTQTEKVYEMDRGMAEIASSMHLHGVPMDREINNNLLIQFRDVVKDAEKAINEVANDPETLERIKHYISMEQAHVKRKKDPEDYTGRKNLRFNDIQTKLVKGKWKWSVDKAIHVVGLLRAIGVNLFKKTDSGRTATSKDILEGLVDQPIVRRIVQHRENSKLLSTFVWSIFDRQLGDGSTVYGFADENDRVHPSWSVTKISGRWASTEPVLSNVPKADFKKNRPNLRKQVVAPNGRLFVGFDFRQLEARGIALVSGDPWLSNVVRQPNSDIHREAMNVVWGKAKVDLLEKNDPKLFKILRDAVKRFEFGAFYGGSVETLWKTLLKDDQAAKLADVAAAVHLLMRAMPGVVAWQDDCMRIASAPPNEIRSVVLGRRRVFPLIAERNEAINIGIQSLGADIMDTGMWRMWQRLRKYNGSCFPILQIHDAAIFECDEDDADEVLRDVEEVFPQEYTHNNNTIPFPIEAKIAKDWAEC